MLAIETKELIISDTLKKKILMIGKFTNTNPIITNGSVINIKGTNVAYVEPHKINIGKNLFLMFDECDDAFVNNLYSKIKLKELENYINSKNLMFLL